MIRIASALGAIAASVALLPAGPRAAGAQAARITADAATIAEARALLTALVAAKTTPEHGSVAAARLVADRFRAAGWPEADVEVVGGSPNHQNVVVRWRATSATAKPVLFMSHLDVVDAKPEDWDTDPFVLREKDGYLYGRGVLDDKAAVAGWTVGLISLRREGWRPSRDIVLILTADEETAANDGTDWLLRNRAPLFDVDFAINSDASGPELHDGKVTAFNVDVAEKATALFDFSVANPGGHSSRPRADNAIYALARALVRLDGFVFPAQLSDLQRAGLARAAETAPPLVADALRAIQRDPNDSVAARMLSSVAHLNAMVRTTCVATQLAAGHATNALPQRAQATVNCRILPGVAPATVTTVLQGVVGDTAVHISLRPLQFPAAPPTPMRDDVRALLERAVHASWGRQVRVQPTLSLGASDGSFTRARGIPTYTIWFTPLDPADMRAHGRDERILVRSFDEAVSFARNVIREAAGPASR
jgi:acetylornithine deacetylase/succinyl-diaminopimelate desuccinylase-like protein